MNRTTKRLLSLAVVTIASFVFSGCKNWEYNVDRNDIHFKKIHQSEGGTYVGYMTEDRSIGGFPCEKGWIHFRSDWQLLSFQLSEAFMYKGTRIPAHTWVHFPYHADQTGYVLSLPENYEVQGYRCGGSGGYKGTHTSFYDSGKLRSFFPPKDVVVNDIPCESSPFASVTLYEDGSIKSCKLAEDYETNGIRYKKGEILEFDENGSVK
jgi:hypothetical protein